MFHRVKSEVQNENEKPTLVSTNDDAPIEKTEDKTEKTELQTPQTTLEIEVDEEQDNTETTSEADTQTPSPEKEDTLEMTENDKNTDTETTESAISPYQRTGAAPAASGYTGSSYPGASYGAKAAQSDSAAGDRRLTIGRGITMSGEIESCDYLLVEGTVEAALKGANMLEIAESGTFYGTVEIEDANISGRFEGDITVNGRLTISSTATVTGSIAYKELEIEAGAVIEGSLTPTSGVSPAAASKPTASKLKAPTQKAKKVDTQPEPANTDEGLFSKATAAAE